MLATAILILIISIIVTIGRKAYEEYNSLDYFVNDDDFFIDSKSDSKKE